MTSILRVFLTTVKWVVNSKLAHNGKLVKTKERTDVELQALA